jgi:hypothetical protein
MDANILTTQELAALLKEAEQAHAAYEKSLGAPDSNWPTWYADFIIKKLRSKPEKSTKPLTDALETAHANAEPDNRPLPDTGALARARASSAAADPAALRVCPTCAHRNRPGTLLCDNCGTNLTTGQQAALGTRDLRDPESVEKPATGKLPGDKPATDKQTVGAVAPASPVSRLDSAEVRAIRTAGTGVFEDAMVLRIEIEGGAAPITLKPEAKDMILGRRDPTTGATPEVDLTPYAGYRMGVSRNHASLKLTDNQLNLWDLGSSNGTFLNGSRLSPHRPYPVRDGDEIRLGQMILRLFFQSSPTRKQN